MYNILFVDDEMLVVKGLAYDIDWSDLNISGIYKAYSARQAIEILEHTRMDIVVTDISMPEEDGIQLSRMIKKRWPSAVIIFLSGYDDFEYAQKAIELSIFSYVTKPVQYEEFKKVVGGAIIKLEDELCKEQILLTARKSLEQIKPIIQERYLNSWIVKGIENPVENPEKLLASGLDLIIDESVFLTVVRVDESSGVANGEEEGVLELTLKELVCQWFFNEKKVVFFKDEQGKFVILYNSKDIQECRNQMKYMEEVAEPFKESVRRTLGCIISIFFGEVTEVGFIHNAYRKIDTIARRRVSNSTGIIMLTEKVNSQNVNARLNILYENPDFSLIIDSLDVSKGLERIDRIFNEVEKNENIERASLLEIYNVISGVVIQASFRNGLDISQWAGEDERTLYNFEAISKLSELKSWCVSIICKLMECIKNKEKKQYNHIVERAKKMIEESYTQDISVAEIASYLYLHPNYLTRMFKRETGMTLMDYISYRRIESAKKLLGQPGFKVYEVAERIGYESIAHFNRIFKRETGMSPKEYQRLVHKDI